MSNSTKEDVELIKSLSSKNITCMLKAKKLEMVLGLCLEQLEAQYVNFDFDEWYKSWGYGSRHPAEIAIKEAKRVLSITPIHEVIKP